MPFRTQESECVVCGAQASYHANWFVVVENRWLDRLRVFSWHPLRAQWPGMHSVCGDPHLRILVQHWLSEANLDLRQAARGLHPAPFEKRARGMESFRVRQVARRTIRGASSIIPGLDSITPGITVHSERDHRAGNAW